MTENDRDELDEMLRDSRVVEWFSDNLADVRKAAFGDRLLYQSLAVAFILGLIAYVAGYLLRSTAAAEPLGLLADLLYGFGLALWTGVIVALFSQVIPEIKRRQFRAALEAYEAALRERGNAGPDPG